MAVCGTGYGLFFAPNAKLIVSAAPIERAASAGGLIATNRLAGQASGPRQRQFARSGGRGTDFSRRNLQYRPAE
jgi:DHA2 family multidrug resistance protein-like MFS transporter